MQKRMEFYLPSLLIIFIAAGIVFGLLPRFTPFLLAILASVLLIAALLHHFAMFRTDYRTSTWQENASGAAPYILGTFLGLFILGYILSLYPASKAATVAVITKAVNKIVANVAATNATTTSTAAKVAASPIF